MRWVGYKAFYYPAFPINKITLIDIPVYRHGIKTGGMDAEEFTALKENIAERGLINPIVMERRGVYRIEMGNNRAEVMKQLGHTHIPAIALMQGDWPLEEGYIEIPTKELEQALLILHPGDETWRKALNVIRVLKTIPQVSECTHNWEEYRQVS